MSTTSRPEKTETTPSVPSTPVKSSSPPSTREPRPSDALAKTAYGWIRRRSKHELASLDSSSVSWWTPESSRPEWIVEKPLLCDDRGRRELELVRYLSAFPTAPTTRALGTMTISPTNRPVPPVNSNGGRSGSMNGGTSVPKTVDPTAAKAPVSGDTPRAKASCGTCRRLVWFGVAGEDPESDWSLDRWLETKPSLEARKATARALVDAVEWLHAHDVVHHDLKPANVLVNKDGQHVRLIDFGTSCRISLPASSRLACARRSLATLDNGTPVYRGPYRDRARSPTEETQPDWWAVGFMIGQLMVDDAAHPFERWWKRDGHRLPPELAIQWFRSWYRYPSGIRSPSPRGLTASTAVARAIDRAERCWKSWNDEVLQHGGPEIHTLLVRCFSIV